MNFKVEQILKETAKKAPVVTAALVTFIWVVTKILDKELPDITYGIIAFLTFLLSSLVIYLNYSGNKKTKPEVDISGQDISGVDTQGGKFTMGSNKSNVRNVSVKDNAIKDVKTGGGDFTIGSNGG